MRFSRKHAAVGLLLIALFAAFSFFLLSAADGRAGRLSRAFSDLNLAICGSFEKIPAFTAITDFLLGLALTTCLFFAGYGLLCLIRGRGLAAVPRYLWYLGGLYALVVVIYLVFEILSVTKLTPTATWAPFTEYPSTHALIAFAVFPSSALTARRFSSLRKALPLLDAAAVLLCLLMALGRLLAGEHLFSDVVGAAMAGLGLFFLYAAAALPMQEK